MSAVTLAFFPADTAIVLFGPATPINEQLDQAQDWAGKELVPVAGITMIEVWSPSGVRARFNFPENATVDTETPWGVTGMASVIPADLGVEVAALQAEILLLKETNEKLTAAAATTIAESASEKPADPLPPPPEAPAQPEPPVLTLPPNGGPAKAKGK